MNYSVSQTSNIRQINPMVVPPDHTSRKLDFTRTPTDISIHGSKDAQSAQDGVGPHQFARGAAPAAAQGPAKIPPNLAPVSREFAMLKDNARILISLMGRNPARQSGMPFMTNSGERGLLKFESPGMAAIHVNGKPMLKCFHDHHNPDEVHILMRGPDERMHAGRDLPQDYLRKGNALVGSAQTVLTGRSQVQFQARRWGN